MATAAAAVRRKSGGDEGTAPSRKRRRRRTRKPKTGPSQQQQQQPEQQSIQPRRQQRPTMRPKIQLEGSVVSRRSIMAGEGTEQALPTERLRPLLLAFAREVADASRSSFDQSTLERMVENTLVSQGLSGLLVSPEPPVVRESSPPSSPMGPPPPPSVEEESSDGELEDELTSEQVAALPVTSEVRRNGTRAEITENQWQLLQGFLNDL